VAENVPGFRWVRSKDADFAEAGVRIPWHYNDMILTFEPGTSTVKEVIPIDRERVEVDFDRLARIPGLEYLLDKLKPKNGREKRWISEEWKQRRLAKA
jgi:hypothetical protein